eukprot:10564676-Lingulodinium_polyedra.AAC.1
MDATAPLSVEAGAGYCGLAAARGRVPGNLRGRRSGGARGPVGHRQQRARRSEVPPVARRPSPGSVGAGRRSQTREIASTHRRA